MPRTIVIRIVVDNREALNAIKQQREEQKKLQEATAFTNAEMRKSEAHSKRMAQGFDSANKSTSQLSTAFAVGYLKMLALSKAVSILTQSFSYLVTETAQIELSMAKVAAVTGDSDADIARLKETVFSLGRVTAASNSEIAEAALELAKLGFEGKTLEVSLAGVARLSSILGDSLVTTGALVGGVIQTFDLSAEQAATVADKLFVATGKSATNIEGFRVAFGLAGNVAADAGISFEELAAAVATLSNQGIRASTIGTGLRNFIVELSKEGSKAQLALGGSIEGMGLLGAMEKLAMLKPTSGALVDMFGKPGSPAASGLSKATEEYQRFLDMVSNGNGQLDTAKDKINDTLIGSLTILKNSLVELFAVSTTGPAAVLVDVFNGLAKQINTVTDGVKELNKVMDILKGGDNALDSKYHLGETTVSGGKIRGPNITDLQKRLAQFAEADKADIRNTDEVYEAQFGKKAKDKFDDSAAQAAIAAAKLEAEAKRIKAASDEIQNSFSKISVELDRQEFDNVNLNDEEVAKYADQLLKISEAFAKIGNQKDALAVLKAAKEFKKKQEGQDEYVSKFYEGVDDTVANIGMDLNKTSQELKDNPLTKMPKSDLKTWVDGIKTSYEELNVTVELLSFGFESMLAASDAFTDKFVDNLFAGKNAFHDFGEVFKGISASIIKELISMGVRMLAFRAITALFGGPAAAIGAGAFTPIFGGSPIPFNAAANGYDGMVKGPHMFLAGEAGPERVTITPLGKGGAASNSGSGMTIVVQGDIYNAEKFIDKINQSNEKSRTRYV
jgi:TP901 family phage tail tape measure protein